MLCGGPKENVSLLLLFPMFNCKNIKKNAKKKESFLGEEEEQE